MQCDIPILVIAFHGAYDENKVFKSPINAAKINATSVGTCNYLTEEVPKAIPILAEKFRMEYDCDTMVEKLREELFNIDHRGMELRSGKIDTPLEKSVRSSWKEEKDPDAKEFMKSIPNSYQIYNIMKDSDVQNKSYEIKKSNVNHDDYYPYDDRIVLLYPDGSEKDIVPSWKKGDYSLFPDRPSTDPNRPSTDPNRPSTDPSYYYENEEDGPDGVYIDLVDIMNRIRDQGFNDVIIIDLACNALAFPRLLNPVAARDMRHESFKFKRSVRQGEPRGYGGGLRNPRTQKSRTRKLRRRKPRTRKHRLRKKRKKIKN